MICRLGVSLADLGLTHGYVEPMLYAAEKYDMHGPASIMRVPLCHLAFIDKPYNSILQRTTCVYLSQMLRSPVAGISFSSTITLPLTSCHLISQAYDWQSIFITPFSAVCYGLKGAHTFWSDFNITLIPKPEDCGIWAYLPISAIYS